MPNLPDLSTLPLPPNGEWIHDGLFLAINSDMHDFVKCCVAAELWRMEHEREHFGPGAMKRKLEAIENARAWSAAGAAILEAMKGNDNG